MHAVSSFSLTCKTETKKNFFYDIAISQKNESYYLRNKEDMEWCYLRRKQQQKILLFDSISDDKNDKIVK
jgi:hypothetical protein